jgi:5'-nucleotidase
MTRPLIIITNDDGFNSPGLWAAARAVEDLGDVLVVAPVEQQSGAGRSMPSTSLGHIHMQEADVSGHAWRGYAVHGTPAQAVQHALLELAPRPPALLIAGINYGENVGSGVTISGTVGAALEAAAFGLPAMAVSMETEKQYHLSHSTDIDFEAAAHFTRFFAEKLLALARPADVDVLKVEVPAGATPATPWRVTRVSRQRYFLPLAPDREDLAAAGPIDYKMHYELGEIERDSDVYALIHDRVVSVTPLSLDLTSRVDLAALGQLLGKS